MNRASSVLGHPVLIYGLTIVALTGLALILNVPIARVSEVAIYMLYALGVNLLLGYTGLVAFGASLFFGTGTYVAAIGTLRVADNEILGLLAAVIFAMLLGLAVGALVLRRRGIYFSLLTLAFSQLAFEVAYKWTAVTGGENGLQGVGRPLFGSTWSFHLFTCLLVGANLWLMWIFVHSAPGRLFQAVRDNEERAACLGYDTYRTKLLSFTLSAAVVGLAGGLLAFLIRGAYANNLNWAHAADALLMAVLGGVPHILGPIWGAAAFIFIRDQVSLLVEHWWLVFAPIIVVFVLLSPEGIHGIFQRLFGRRHRTLVRPGIPPRPETIRPYRGRGSATGTDGSVLQIKGLSKRFGSLVTARDISFDVQPRTLHSLIGPNGAGKTTFFNMVTGLLPSDSGQILFKGQDLTGMPAYKRARLGLSRSFQIISLFEHLTAFETVRLAVQSRHPGKWNPIRDAVRNDRVNEEVWSILAAVHLDHHAARITTNLSHGEQRLLDIAIVLATGGELLLLDEPLAGLSESDRETVGSIVSELAKTHAVMMIEHDIDRVMALSSRITVLHQGALIADGPPQEVAQNPDVIAAYIGAVEGDSLASGAVIRRARTDGERPVILELENTASGYEGSRVLDGLNLELREGEVLALLGRNGVGKTTALKMITGALPLESGSIKLDGNEIGGLPSYRINRMGIGLVPEGRRLFPNLTVVDNLKIAMRPGGISLEEAFELFPKLDVLRNSKASNLSGGERQMLAIARSLMFPARVILLDEPFEGLAPAVVKEVIAAVAKVSERASVIIVEHNADLVLPLADRAVVLVNGKVVYDRPAEELQADKPLQARLLGVTHSEAA
jgi:ABC-type branched-subunit amino acid transport system ATPase component/ABC-type branched-subunit amino acid transport system permease subunit